MTKREPAPLTGKYGTASNFGSIDGWTLAEAQEYLSELPDITHKTVTKGGYVWFKFKDGCEFHIRPNGEVLRLPHRMYTEEGRRITWYRINIFTGEVMLSDDWHKLPRDQQEWVVIT